MAVAATLGLVFAAPGAFTGLDLLHRLNIDLLLPLRHALYGPLFTAPESDVVVVAIDEETYRTPPFDGLPEVAWTPLLAKVLEAVHAAGPKVMGLDLIYPTSLDRPGLLRGYDKPLLQALFKSGRAGDLVMGQVRLSEQRIAPYPSQLAAAGGGANLRTLNLLLDRDDVVRRYPAAFNSESSAATPSFGVELALRAGLPAPRRDFLINFNSDLNAIPTYGLADLYACSESGQSGFFEKFHGKIVIFGSLLDVEDRRLSAARFLDGRLDRSTHPRCRGAFDAARYGEIIDRHSMPGIYLHAAAVNTLTKDLPLALMAPLQRFATVFFATAGVALLFFVMAPAFGVAVMIGGLAAAAAGATAMLQSGTVAPFLLLAAAWATAFATVYAYRFVVEDKQKRWIQFAFRHFLAPTLVDRLAEDPSVLKLGGVQREVTVFFSDLAGFTDLSETMKDEPAKLLAILNRYLTVVAGLIEKHGGYVDKFIGDAVMAVWGAPLDNPEAERHAVDAALDCQDALARFNDELAAERKDAPRLHTRMGINTGVAVVGNMGSRTRLNYTVAGDTVNLAARLEGANKFYGSLILISESTAERLGDGYVIRCLDFLAVKGRQEPVRVHEVLGRKPEASADLVQRTDAFNAAFELYQTRQFEAARAAFLRYADADEASALYVARCTAFMADPPGPDWDGSFKLTSK